MPPVITPHTSEFRLRFIVFHFLTPLTLASFADMSHILHFHEPLIVFISEYFLSLHCDYFSCFFSFHYKYFHVITATLRILWHCAVSREHGQAGIVTFAGCADAITASQFLKRENRGNSGQHATVTSFIDISTSHQQTVFRSVIGRR